jgi:hypothetical protein
MEGAGLCYRLITKLDLEADNMIARLVPPTVMIGEKIALHSSGLNKANGRRKLVITPDFNSQAESIGLS